MNNGKCLSNWVIPEKIHTPTTEGMLENLTGEGGGGGGGGLTTLIIQMGRGVLNLTLHSGLTSCIHPCFHRLNR